MIRFLLGLVLLTALSLALPYEGRADSNQVTICHALGMSNKDGYTVVTAAAAGIFNGHLGSSQGHQTSEDIIPPFEFRGQTYSQNWDAEGQLIYNSGCAQATETPTNTATSTATSTATATNTPEECVEFTNASDAVVFCTPTPTETSTSTPTETATVCVDCEATETPTVTSTATEVSTPEETATTRPEPSVTATEPSVARRLPDTGSGPIANDTAEQAAVVLLLLGIAALVLRTRFR